MVWGELLMNIDSYMYAISILFNKAWECYKDGNSKGALNYTHQISVVSGKVVEIIANKLQKQEFENLLEGGLDHDRNKEQAAETNRNCANSGV